MNNYLKIKQQKHYLTHLWQFVIESHDDVIFLPFNRQL